MSTSDVQVIRNSRYEVLTDEGWKDFSGMSVAESSELVAVSTSNGMIECTFDHLLFTRTGWKEAKDLVEHDEIKTEDGWCRVHSIVYLDRIEKVYDLLDVQDVHAYFTNGLLSHNCLYLDEMAFLPREQEFYESTYPVITSGKETKVIITSTPKGARGLFYNLWQGAINQTNAFTPIKVTWRQIPGRDDKWAQETKSNMTEAQWNQEFEVEFQGSQNTLIPYSVLSNIFTMDPIDGLTDNDSMDIYEEPIPGHKYFITVDTARGFGGDFSAFVVYDITQIPFKQVAKYKNNRISTILYPSVVYNTALHYNEAEVLVEINDAGGEVANKLFYDYEYENTLMTSKDGGKIMLGGYGTSALLGLRTTKSTKAIGCGTLKMLVEKEKLAILDVDTVNELTNFVEKGASYEADDGCHDDLAMNLVLFAWATTQEHFKQHHDLDVKKRFEEEAIARDEAELMPFGFIESHAYDEPVSVDDYMHIREANVYDPTF